MSGPMAWIRALCALVATSGMLLACSSPKQESAAAPADPAVTAAPVSAAPAVPLKAPVPLAPGAPACGQGAAVLSEMSNRDKLAQLLMVGVSNAADARAVVDDHHIGGIMIGSWTDLSMMGAPLADIAASAGPLPLAVSVDAGWPAFEDVPVTWS